MKSRPPNASSVEASNPPFPLPTEVRWGWPVLLGLAWAAYAGLVEGLLRARISPERVVLVDDGGRALLALVGAWLALGRGRRTQEAFAALWRAAGWALLWFGLGTLYLVITHDWLNLKAPITTFRHLGYLAALGCQIWAVLELPVESFLPSQRVQALLDGLLISAAIFFIAWGDFLRQLVTTHWSPGSPYALTLIYPLLSIALGALWIFQESRLMGGRGGLQGLFLRIAIGVMVVWWPCYSIGNIEGWSRQFGVAERVDVLFSLGFLFFGLGALWPEVFSRWVPKGPLGRDRQSLLPFVPALLAMAYGATLLLRGERFDFPMVATGTLLGAVLTIRQYLTVRDLDNLSVELERRVQARTGELIRSQQELAKSQRSQLIAGMAAGFAHDFKNLLGVILNWVELLRSDPEGEELDLGLNTIEKATGQALALVQNILAAGRLQELVPQSFDLVPFLKACGPSLDGALGGRGTLVWALPEGPLPVFMDLEKLNQALLNLASNAADAMAESGTLTIQAWLDPVENFTVLTLADTGRGIPPEHLERIFEPFFTTKPVGKGTGLGLSSVYGTLLQSGGTLTVTSQVGKGSVFTMRLPRAGTSQEINAD